MFRIVTLMLLACALIVPRAAWGAHLTGHEELSVATAIHTHHADHTHERDGAMPDHEDGSDGLTHEHSPSFALGSAIVLPDLATLPLWVLASEAQVEQETDSGPHRHPDSLLRPPRAA